MKIQERKKAQHFLIAELKEKNEGVRLFPASRLLRGETKIHLVLLLDIINLWCPQRSVTRR